MTGYEQYQSLLEKHKPKYVVGIDETGNGAIAGPLCVSACALPVNFDGGFKDSKKYSEPSREKAYLEVLDKSLFHITLMRSPNDIMSLGHGPALDSLIFNALYYSYAMFKEDAIYLLDGVRALNDVRFTHYAIPKADDFVQAVSAASIIAKCERDDYMVKTKYPEWEFYQHKGYPTAKHVGMLNEMGPIRGFHRTNIETVRKALETKGWYR